MRAVSQAFSATRKAMGKASKPPPEAVPTAPPPVAPEPVEGLAASSASNAAPDAWEPKPTTPSTECTEASADLETVGEAPKAHPIPTDNGASSEAPEVPIYPPPQLRSRRRQRRQRHPALQQALRKAELARERALPEASANATPAEDPERVAPPTVYPEAAPPVPLTPPEEAPPVVPTPEVSEAKGRSSETSSVADPPSQQPGPDPKPKNNQLNSWLNRLRRLFRRS